MTGYRQLPTGRYCRRSTNHTRQRSLSTVDPF